MTEDEYRSFINTLADIENTHTDRNAETFTIEGTIFRLEKIPDTINEYMLIDDIKYTCTRTVSPDVIKNNLPKYCKRSW